MLSLSSPPVLKPSPLSSHFTITPKTAAPSIRFRPTRIISAAHATAERGNSTTTCLRPPQPAACSSLYEVLRVPVGATCQEIKSAYRRLARMCHPDVDRKDSSADEFMKVHAAYSTLTDPAKRADYDRKFLPLHRSFRSYSGISASPVSSTSRFSGYTSRNWESDQCW